jgi:hypothetical protein
MMNYLYRPFVERTRHSAASLHGSPLTTGVLAWIASRGAWRSDIGLIQQCMSKSARGGFLLLSFECRARIAAHIFSKINYSSS